MFEVKLMKGGGMIEFEAPMSPGCISEKSGKSISAEQVREWCHRETDPLPHVKSGRRLKIRWSDFCSYYEQEVARTTT